MSRSNDGGVPGDGRAAVSFSGAGLSRRRSVLAALAASAVAAAPPSRSARAADHVDIVGEPLAFRPDGDDTAGRLAYRGGLALSASDPRFGGWSDLHVSGTGDRLTMVSDAGHAFVAPMRLEPGGGPAAIGPGTLQPFVDLGGRPLPARRWGDAEGLAPAPDGGFYVSFEHEHRLWHYPAAAQPFSRRPRALALPPGLEQAPENGGLEAIAAWPDGSLVAFAEELADANGDLRAWFGGPTAWREFAWAHEGYRPTGAAVAPDGSLLVLERRFALFSFAARILRVPRERLREGARVEGELIGEWYAPAAIDNFEGIAARRGAGGETLVYVVSDDNFRRLLQRTLLLCFAIAPD
ncbi:MAG: esterase-like activity of phytase family protein [Alphaproteobacteria bacterium]|nr:esterase-like activity of phytase family protein [Alphaproteobacteria bacterium]